MSPSARMGGPRANGDVVDTGSDIVLADVSIDPAVARAAALTVAERAAGADDARHLLDVLGLSEQRRAVA